MAFVSQKEVERLMGIDTEVKGIGITDDFSYVKETKGKKFSQKMEKAIQGLGIDFNLKKLKPMEFYPVGLEGLGLLAAHKIAGLSEDEIREMGSHEPKESLIIRLFLKYFASLDSLSKNGDKMWSGYYTKGKLSVPETDEAKGRAIILLKNFKLHPLHCRMLEGYLATLAGMVVSSKVKCRETKCPFNGDEFHKFKLEF